MKLAKPMTPKDGTWGKVIICLEGNWDCEIDRPMTFEEFTMSTVTDFSSFRKIINGGRVVVINTDKIVGVIFKPMEGEPDF